MDTTNTEKDDLNIKALINKGEEYVKQWKLSVEPPPKGETWLDIIKDIFGDNKSRHKSMVLHIFKLLLALTCTICVSPRSTITLVMIEASRNIWAVSSIIETGNRQQILAEFPLVILFASLHPAATFVYVMLSWICQLRFLHGLLGSFEYIDDSSNATIEKELDIDPPIKIRLGRELTAEERHWLKVGGILPLAASHPVLFLAYLLYHARSSRPETKGTYTVMKMDVAELDLRITEQGKGKEAGKDTHQKEAAKIDHLQCEEEVRPLPITRKDEDPREEVFVGNVANMLQIDTWDDSSDKVPIEEETHIQHFAYPGSGKTRNIATKYRGIITGPTRVVCKSAAEGFKDAGIAVDLKIAGGDKGRKNDTMIIPHASLLRDIEQVEGETVVMDETHFENLETQLLLKILRSLAKKGRIKLVELTATGYNIKTGKHVIAKESNHPIEEIELPADVKEEDIQRIIKEEREKGARIMVFKPNSTAVQGENVFNLNRKTFDKNYEKVRDMPPGSVVYATNIAECGANFNLDVVIDLQQQIRPTPTKHDEVKLHRSSCTIPAATQRRGRVGRTRPGKYYYVNRAHGYTDPLIESEAKELFELYEKGEHHIPFAWLQTEINTLKMMKFCCDKYFKLLPPDTLRKKVDAFRLEHPDKRIDARCPDAETALDKFVNGPCSNDRYRILQRDLGLIHAKEREQGYPN